MKKETMMRAKSWMPLISIVIFGFFGPVMADSDSKEIQALTKEIRALSAEVASLRKSVALLETLKPNLTMLMPNFSERFHVMHYAGEAGDWAVAAHELQEMQRMIEVMTAIAPEKGALIKGFMTGSLNKLNAAIEHGNLESFDKALSETVKNCNACHSAVGSEFVQVQLDAERSLSMRHSHTFMHRKMMGEHKHKHSE
jgi:cytochrome c556